MRTPPVQRFGAAKVTPPPGAFLQATPHGEAALITAVREAVGEARHVIDLFAGSGTFSLPLADRAEVHAVEGDAAMTAALDHGWRMSTGLKPVTTEARDLFRRPLLPDELAKTDAVVIDPPRAGAEAQIAEIVKAMPPVLAYVSCNPVTFARDAAVLIAAGYTLNCHPMWSWQRSSLRRKYNASANNAQLRWARQTCGNVWEDGSKDGPSAISSSVSLCSTLPCWAWKPRRP